MERRHTLLALIWRSWPVIVPLALVLAWWFVSYRAFPSHAVIITKVTAATMQVIGGFAVLYSINDNFNLFRKQSLKDVFVAYMGEFAAWWRPRDVTIALSGVAATSSFGSVGAFASFAPTSLEERVAQLEQAVERLTTRIALDRQELDQKIDMVSRDLRTLIDTHAQSLDDLHKMVDKVNVGGFKPLLFGALLAMSGAVLGVLS